MTNSNNSKLTLGPVLFNWNPEKWRDFYFKIADEADVDTVNIGEMVCSKRTPFFEPYIGDVAERLMAGGKEVVFSTLSLIMTKREMDGVRALTEAEDLMVEANDISAAALLAGRPHIIGPMVNVYNEGTLAYLVRQGATRISLPGELPKESLEALVASTEAELEVQVFGRLPLAISARCYHARSRGWTKDSCQYACEDDPDGMELDTIDGEAFLAVNGTQTMSYSCCNLGAEIPEMQEMGINRFRISPHDTDMVRVLAIYRGLANGTLAVDEADEELEELMGGLPFSNGFYHGIEGSAFAEVRPQGE